MKTKILSLLAIIAVSPFMAYADVGPAAYSGDGDLVMPTDSAPYATANISNDDYGHIAPTAYVKGAYNETFAAVNRLSDDVNGFLDDVVRNAR